MADIEAIVSASTFRIRRAEPFFASLLLFANIRSDKGIGTAATDGRNIWFNPDYIAELSPPEIDALILHEVLHCALLHTTRRGGREPMLWNIAADIVVNGQVRQCGGMKLPDGAVVDAELEKFSAEEVYSILLRKGINVQEMVVPLDLLEPAGDGDMPGQSSTAELEAYWSAARHKAQAVARLANAQRKGRGMDPADFSREYALIDEAQLNWRQYLWRFLVRTPTDFTGFDRRFIGEGLYLDAQEGESLDVCICIDTSGSVSEEELGQFRAEVLSILRCYPHINATLFYADAGLYGPYHLKERGDWPEPTGGGGTDFRPLFKYLEKNPQHYPPRLIVYLTDGYGGFPEAGPHNEVLWVVVPGGLPSDEYPFGDVARLI
jgi:predicted metal-dependent peptidase